MTALVLLPRDGLFLKDGREWASGAAGRAHSLGWPAPSTLLGALCTATGRVQEITSRRVLKKEDWGKLRDQMRLELTLAVRRRMEPSPPAPQRNAQPQPRKWLSAHRMWPVPADAVFIRDEPGKPAHIHRLNPQKPLLTMLGADDCPVREAMWRPMLDGQVKPAIHKPWWTETAFVRWLTEANDAPAWAEDPPNDFASIGLDSHTQVHVGIKDDTQAAEEGRLFAHDVVETIEQRKPTKQRKLHEHYEWGIACRFTAPGKPITGRVTLGGDRRVAAIETTDDTLFEFPNDIRKAFDTSHRGLRLVAVTPAAFDAGWLLPGFAEHGGEYRGKIPGIADMLILRAACIGRAAHVSGWDMANNQPKPTTRLVPPGSVYFLHKVEAKPFTRTEAEQVWRSPIGNRTNEGFGRFMPGIWF
jgi:CRISPR-associated protein Cmr3